MKIYKMVTSFVLIAISCTVVFSQDNPFVGPEDNLEAANKYNQPKQLAPDAALLILDLKNKRTQETLEQKFPLIQIKDAYYVSALMKVSADFDIFKMYKPNHWM